MAGSKGREEGERRGGAKKNWSAKQAKRKSHTQTHTHSHSDTLTLTHSDTQREGEKAPPTSGPNNILLYQRFIVNQLAEAAGVCEVGGTRGNNGQSCCITI